MNPALVVIAPLLMPVIFPYIGDAVSHALKQDHFTRRANDAIAWTVLVLAALGDAWIEGQINPPVVGHTVNWALAVLQVVDGAAVILLAGPLVKLGPWVQGMQWLQGHIFALPLSTIGQAPASTVTVVNTTGQSKGGGNVTAANWQPSRKYSQQNPLSMPKEPPKTQLPPSHPGDDLGG